MSKVKDPFLVNTFGDDVLDRGFTAVPNVMLDHQNELGLSDNEMLFFIKTYRANGRRVSEKDIGMKSKHTTFWRMKKRLVSAGLLKTKEIYTHSENKKIKCLGTVFDWSGLIKKARFILKQHENDEALPFQKEIAGTHFEIAPAQIEISPAKLEQSLKTSSKTSSQTSSKSEEVADAPGAEAPSKSLLFDNLISIRKQTQTMPIPPARVPGKKPSYSRAHSELFGATARATLDAIEKADGVELATEVFSFAAQDQFWSKIPVVPGRYDQYKAAYMAKRGNVETPVQVNERIGRELEEKWASEKKEGKNGLIENW